MFQIKICLIDYNKIYYCDKHIIDKNINKVNYKYVI